MPSDEGDTCQSCSLLPRDSYNCEADTIRTLANLNLTDGHWRLSSMTRDIRSCPKGACIGGRVADDYCAPGLTGPLCQACSLPNYYFDADSEIASCRPCPSDATGYGVMVGTIVLILLFFTGVHFAMRSYPRWKSVPLVVAFQGRCQNAAHLGYIGKMKARLAPHPNCSGARMSPIRAGRS